MKLQMYQADAFTGTLFRRNPAAVVLLDHWLADSLLQAIAAENNLAETAFLLAGDKAGSWQLRWFTPTEEVPFCGHATLASAAVLHQRKGIVRPMRFSTKVGDITVSIADNGYIIDIPRFDPVFDVADDHLVNGFRGDGWVQTFRNFENYFFELRSQRDVIAFTPDLYRLADLGSWGLCVTAPGHDCDFVSRYFAPGAGIPEDPVTGSTHSTLTPFWAGKLGKNRLSARQLSKRGGELECQLIAERVYLEGQAVIFMDAEIFLPSGHEGLS